MLEGVGKSFIFDKKSALKIYKRSVRSLSNLGVECFFAAKFSQ